MLRELRFLRRAVEAGAFASRVGAETAAAHFQHSLASSPEPRSELEKRELLERGQRRWNGAINAIRDMVAMPGGEYLSQFEKTQTVSSEDFPHVPEDVLAKLTGSD